MTDLDYCDRGPCAAMNGGAEFRAYLADALLASDVLRDMLAEAEARGRAEADRILDDVLAERDEREDWADRLAYAIAPQEVIGEHSSANNPWENALEQLVAREQTAYERGVAEATAVVKAALDEWEFSYGMTPLPEHWGITHRIADLRDALADRGALDHVRAEAWDEGYETGRDDENFAQRGLSTDPDAHEYPHDNPYRLERDGGA